MGRTFDAIQDEVERRRASAATASSGNGPAGESEARPPELEAGARSPSADTGSSATRALVAAVPPRSGRFGRWIQRMTGILRSPTPVAVPQELHERVRALTAQLAVHEEQTAKRLAESEARALHLLQERLEGLEHELRGALREVAAREVEERTGGLRARVAVVAVIAVVAVLAAGVALVRISGAAAG